MNILVACEESQTVTIELRRLGHMLSSCFTIRRDGADMGRLAAPVK